jgi:AbrB family looped-hinge helix DNA binding protein
VREFSGTFTSKGQLVIPAELRRKHGIEAGTRVKFVEDQFGRIVLQPITEDYVDRVMGCLTGGPDLLRLWEIEHRHEGEREL